jgi:DNA-binding ferritin-like protein
MSESLNYWTTSGSKLATAQAIQKILLTLRQTLNNIQDVIDIAENADDQFDALTEKISTALSSIDNITTGDIRTLIRQYRKVDVANTVVTLRENLDTAVSDFKNVLQDIRGKFDSNLSSTDTNSIVNYSKSDLESLFKIADIVASNLETIDVTDFYLAMGQFSEETRLSAFYPFVHDFYVNARASTRHASKLGVHVESLHNHWDDFVNYGIHDHTALDIGDVDTELETLETVIEDLFDAISNGVDKVATNTDHEHVTNV